MERGDVENKDVVSNKAQVRISNIERNEKVFEKIISGEIGILNYNELIQIETLLKEANKKNEPVILTTVKKRLENWVEYLIKIVKNIDDADTKGMTPMRYARIDNNTTITHILINTPAKSENKSSINKCGEIISKEGKNENKQN